ncbi:hypothetical protein AB1Y20_022601 [Prymnesium parvum]|uniref:Purine nucleoside permease n=1 Tax=Prymnesium parvum TaxID=97485 RepID=A0AB34JGS9_PRYPA
MRMAPRAYPRGSELAAPLLPPVPTAERAERLLPLLFLRALIPAACVVFLLLVLQPGADDTPSHPLGGELRVGEELVDETFSPRTVVLTFFEPEFAPWRNHSLKPRRLWHALSGWPLLYFERWQLLVVCTGMGPRRAAAVVTALGFDGRLDLRSSLWLISGVAGIDPLAGTVGAVVWASYITDMASAFYVDRTEVGFPQEWETSWLPLTCTSPFCDGEGSRAEAESDELAFKLNHSLVNWAYETTRHIKLPDSREMNATRTPFADAGFTLAAKPPSVIRGDTLSGATVWVGYVSAEWARKWVPYWTGGKGKFATSAMEDSAIATALTLLGRAQRADPRNARRLLSLRAAANFCTQRPGVSISEFVSSFTSTHSNSTNKGKYWRPGWDPVTHQAAVNAARTALIIVEAVARGDVPS